MSDLLDMYQYLGIPGKRRYAAVLVLFIVIGNPFPVVAAGAVVVEQQTIHVSIKDQPYQLNALVGYPAGYLTGLISYKSRKYPVALITHGAAARQSSESLTTTLVARWVRSFAARGYVAVAIMRRGYDRSTGTEISVGTCAHPRHAEYIRNLADDLMATLDVISTWPGIDKTKIIGIGHSAGGAAMLELTSREYSGKSPLAAAISVSGGTYHFSGASKKGLRDFDSCKQNTNSLIAAITEFSTNNRTPTLWLYANNDPFFRPDFVSRMHAAWVGQGATADLRMLPEYEPDGHRMFVREEGVAILLPEIDDFLRAHGLPTWEHAAITDLEKVLNKQKRAFLSKFLSDEVSHKVLATTLDDTDTFFWKTNSSSVEAARIEVLESCRQFSGTECAVVVEDFTPVVTSNALKAMKAAVQDENKGVSGHLAEQNDSNGLNCNGADGGPGEAGEDGGNCGSNNVGDN